MLDSPRRISLAIQRIPLRFGTEGSEVRILSPRPPSSHSFEIWSRRGLQASARLSPRLGSNPLSPTTKSFERPAETRVFLLVRLRSMSAPVRRKRRRSEPNRTNSNRTLRKSAVPFGMDPIGLRPGEARRRGLVELTGTAVWRSPDPLGRVFGFCAGDADWPSAAFAASSSLDREHRGFEMP